MNKEIAKSKSRDELIEELFLELSAMDTTKIIDELRSTVPGPLRVAMDPMYIANKIFQYNFSLKLNYPAKKSKGSVFSWSKYVDVEILAYARNDSCHEALEETKYLMAA